MLDGSCNKRTRDRIKSGMVKEKQMTKIPTKWGSRFMKSLEYIISFREYYGSTDIGNFNLVTTKEGQRKWAISRKTGICTRITYVITKYNETNPSVCYAYIPEVLYRNFYVLSLLENFMLSRPAPSYYIFFHYLYDTCIPRKIYRYPISNNLT